MPETQANKLYYFSIVYRKTGDNVTRHVVINSLTRVGCDDYVFQLERGEKKGKLHWQIFCHVKERVRALTLQRRLGLATDWGVRPCSSMGKEALRSYCMKENTRVEGPFGKKPIYLGEDLRCMENPYPWQRVLMSMLSAIPNDRTIIWIYNAKGNVGKSKLAKYLCVKCKTAKCIPFGTASQIKQNVVAQGQSKIYLVDCPRSRGKAETMNELFSAIEEIKDGWVKSCMYGKFSQLVMNPPHVVVFSNWECPRVLMSSDMWEIYTISDTKHLVRFRVEQGLDTFPNGGNFITDS